MARTENTRYAINIGFSKEQREKINTAADKAEMLTTQFCREIILKRARTVISDQEWLARQVAANPSTQSHSQIPSESQVKR